MVSDSMDGARVTVVKNQFDEEGVETDECGKRGQFFDHAASAF